MTWRVVKDSLLVGRYTAASALNTASTEKRKIAAFDFDSTLITSASGKIFSRDANDWKWWNSNVPGRLKELHQKGYLIAIVSNQGGISLKPDPKTVKSDQKRLSDFKTKVSAVLGQLDLPITIYAATSRDQYRKPRSGMWQEIIDDYDLDSASSLDLHNSLFVGDAGGREAIAGRAVKDHSCVDRCVGIRAHALPSMTMLRLPGTLQPMLAYHFIRLKSSSSTRSQEHSSESSSQHNISRNKLRGQQLHVRSGILSA